MHSHSGQHRFSAVMGFVLLPMFFWIAYTARKVSIGEQWESNALIPQTQARVTA